MFSSTGSFKNSLREICHSKEEVFRIVLGHVMEGSPLLGCLKNRSVASFHNKSSIAPWPRDKGVLEFFVSADGVPRSSLRNGNVDEMDIDARKRW